MISSMTSVCIKSKNRNNEQDGESHESETTIVHLHGLGAVVRPTATAMMRPANGEEEEMSLDVTSHEDEDEEKDEEGKPAKKLVKAVKTVMRNGNNASALLEEEVEEEDEEDDEQIEDEDADEDDEEDEGRCTQETCKVVGTQLHAFDGCVRHCCRTC